MSEHHQVVGEAYLRLSQVAGANNERRVVCAAILYPTSDVLIVGPRHGDEVMRHQLNRFEGDQRPPHQDGIQGFIDQWGVFMDRKEAFLIAQAAGQLRSHRATAEGANPTLYSEDLY